MAAISVLLLLLLLLLTYFMYNIIYKFFYDIYNYYKQMLILNLKVLLK